MQRAMKHGAVALLVLLSGACGESSRTAGGTVSVDELEAGDCVAGQDATAVDAMALLPCFGPHDLEVAGTYTLDDGDYPGVTALTIQTERACRPIFASYVGLGFEESELDLRPLFPARSTWAEGDRRVVCFVKTLDGAALEGPVRQARR